MLKTIQPPQLEAIEAIIKDLCDEYESKQVKAMWNLIKQYDRSDSKGWTSLN
jgi:hypothetical protein